MLVRHVYIFTDFQVSESEGSIEALNFLIITFYI